MTKEVPVDGGRVFAIVDDEDYCLVMQYTWHSGDRGQPLAHIYKGRLRTTIPMSRLVMGDPVGMVVDHKNHNQLDNRKSELRICTDANNNHNRRIVKNKASKYKGVSVRPKYPGWKATISPHGKRIHLGYFDKEEDAAIAYNAAALEHFGEFAYLNEIKEENNGQS